MYLCHCFHRHAHYFTSVGELMSCLCCIGLATISRLISTRCLYWILKDVCFVTIYKTVSPNAYCQCTAFNKPVTFVYPFVAFDSKLSLLVFFNILLTMTWYRGSFVRLVAGAVHISASCATRSPAAEAGHAAVFSTVQHRIQAVLQGRLLQWKEWNRAPVWGNRANWTLLSTTMHSHIVPRQY